MVGTAFRHVYASVQIVKGVFDSVANAGKNLTNAIAPFVHEVGKWNPGTIDRMNLAFDNLAASAGRIWEPLVTAATFFANNLNEAFTAMGPLLRELMNKFAGLATEVGTEIFAAFFRIVEASIPVINQLLDDFRLFIPDLRYLMEAFVELSIAAIKVGAYFAGGMLNTISFVVGALQHLGAAIIATANLLPRLIRDLTNPVIAGAMIAIGNGPFAQFERDFRRILAGFQNLPAGQLPGGQGMTIAAQPARHISIEDVGMEARRQSFSQGQDINQQQLAAQQAAAGGIQAILRLLQQTFPQLAAQFNLPPVGIN